MSMVLPLLIAFWIGFLEIGREEEILLICRAHFNRFQNPRDQILTCQCFYWYVLEEFRFPAIHSYRVTMI